MQAYILTHTLNLWVGLKWKKKISECGHVTYQIKGKEVKINIEAKKLALHTPRSLGQVERSDIESLQISFH